MAVGSEPRASVMPTLASDLEGLGVSPPHDCVCVHLPPPLTKFPPFRVASGVSERRPPAACPSACLSVPSLSSYPLPVSPFLLCPPSSACLSLPSLSPVLCLSLALPLFPSPRVTCAVPSDACIALLLLVSLCPTRCLSPLSPSLLSTSLFL